MKISRFIYVEFTNLYMLTDLLDVLVLVLVNHLVNDIQPSQHNTIEVLWWVGRQIILKGKIINRSNRGFMAI